MSGPNDDGRDRPAPLALSRRRFIVGFAGAGIASLLAGCARDPRVTRSSVSTDSIGAAAAPDCLATPEAVEGPFYIEGALVRTDIRDGRPGQPLTLRLAVVDADADCRPIQSAVVDIWHCDASGSYSGFPDGDPDGAPGGRAARFLRGVQVTNANGQAEFLTIYSGWYVGRTVHIHTKVYLNDKNLITSQLYFPQELNDRIFTSIVPYRKRGKATTRNEDDGIMRMAANVLRIGEGSAAMTGDFVIGVRRG